MMRLRTVAIVLFVAATWTTVTSSEDREFVKTAQPQAPETPLVTAEPTMSIFNDAVRRYRFRLEDILVTGETAEGFMLRYKSRNNPEIIGAYPDSETNSLVVVGAPDAEHAIRVSLATWIVERQGIFPSPLNVQKRVLEFKRRELLREMADLEVRSVESESSKAVKILARLRTFEDQLKVVERQIQIVEKYVKRLHDDASGKGLAATIAP